MAEGASAQGQLCEEARVGVDVPDEERVPDDGELGELRKVSKAASKD